MEELRFSQRERWGLARSACRDINTAPRQKQMSQKKNPLLTCPWQERRAQKENKKIKKHNKNWKTCGQRHPQTMALCSHDPHLSSVSGSLDILKQALTGLQENSASHKCPFCQQPTKQLQSSLFIPYYTRKNERKKEVYVGGGGELTKHLWLLRMISTHTIFFFRRQQTPLALLSKWEKKTKKKTVGTDFQKSETIKR